MPIKRNKYLWALSREHHFGLLFCWKIRQGLKNKIELYRIHQYVNYYWNNCLRPHFEEEETVLFNQVKDRLCYSALAQHKKIAGGIEDINGMEKNNENAYKALADLVDNHIRFEERELFPHLESVLTTARLALIGIQLNDLHTGIPSENYDDEFWIKKSHKRL